MTETEWLASTDPKPMLEFLRDKASDRKLRLLAVACCRRIWELLTDERSRKAVDLAEQSADHQISLHTLDAHSAEAEEAFEDAISPDEAANDENREKAGAACSAASYASNSPSVRLSDAVEVMQAAADATIHSAAERTVQDVLIRDLFGNPFRPTPSISPAVLAWNDRRVVLLAQTIYEERRMPEGTLDTSRLAILHDALLDAGCDNEELLTHLRSECQHYRGCWAIDLILGKE